jgi:3-methylcrotonyl-CoA carboxylase alpha subunit
MPIKRLLVANRGEIAVRIMRACRELGIQTVAVFSEADAGALHVRLADQAVAIGAAPAAESYLNVERILQAAGQSGADALHPGYGFLSENAEFARAVRQAGLVFVGPPAEAMAAMGDKIRARELMQAAGVPLAPGFHGNQGAAAAAADIGFPLLVKAAGGGGGRGMRVVHAPDQLQEALSNAQREAAAAFGDGTVYLEKYLPDAHHIEFQVFGDSHGNVLHLHERECSIQRRYQKIIEESPSPLLGRNPVLGQQMARAAVAAASAVGYENAGTVEFVVDPASLDFYFLEMNTRLQVEHPVTELVTGLDLVRLQLLVAAGEPLPFGQDDVVTRGHAIECRVYAEDPADNFYPSIGTLLRVAEPKGPGLRVDSGYESGDTVSQYYDAMLAKVLALADTRPAAIERMQAALSQYAVLGVTTNMAFLKDVLAHEVFQSGTAGTRFIENHMAAWQPGDRTLPDAALVAAALNDLLSRPAGNADAPQQVVPDADLFSPWRATDSFRTGAG